MRVLTVGSLYPPHHLGGYEVLWRSSVCELRNRGHRARVLTTDFRLDGSAGELEDDDVHRELRWYWREHDFPRLPVRGRLELERHNAGVLERHLREIRPHAVAWWAMGGMSLSLIERVRRAGVPSVGIVIDDWLIYGPLVDAWTKAFARPLLRGLAERVTGIPLPPADIARTSSWLFASRTLRSAAARAGRAVAAAPVAHPGVDRELFREEPAGPWRWRLACVGRIDPRKGIELAMRALVHLPAEATLAIVGRGDGEHLARLRSLARSLGLAERVSFGAVPRGALRQAYATADAVLFPVQWAEPWGLVPLEAMSVGRPVVATGTGGSAEYLRDGANCLLFAPRDDPAALAGAVRRLASEPELRERIRGGGRQTAARFSEEAFNEAVAEQIFRVAGAPEPPRGR